MSSNDTLERLAQTLEARKPVNGGDPSTSYVARLLQKGPDAFLKKIGEEATETVMAAKDIDHGGLTEVLKGKLVGEVADLWFHTIVMLGYFDIEPQIILNELARRQGLSGLVEKANRQH